jgi:HPt (histidine-containing phosphotransfer) domain-containing protein
MSTNPATIADALSRLWARFLPEIEIRVGLVAAAASALAAGELTAEQRVQAHEAAHKLAGSLGTFGLHRGTELARRAELALAEEPVAATVAELASWVAELQSLIRDRG